MDGVAARNQAEVITWLQRQHPLETRGFKAALREAFAEPDEDGLDALIDRINVVPDGFILDHEARGISVFEIEVTNKLSQHKLETYARLVTDFHFYGISFVVVSVDRYGNAHPLDLFPAYLQSLAQEAA